MIDWATFIDSQPGRLDGEFTGPIHPADIARLLCDSDLSRIITGPDSLPLDVGRTRSTIPPAIRRALVERDQGCRYPDCGLPAGWCEAHHTKPWYEGGETSLETLVLFCPHHHHVTHQPGWRVEFDGRDLRVFRPDGTEVTAEGFP